MISPALFSTRKLFQFSSVQFSHSVCPTLCDPSDCSMPVFPAHHQLPELAQIHVYQVGDAIQPSHSLSSPSLPAFNLSQHQCLSSQLVLCIRWPKYWSFNYSKIVWIIFILRGRLNVCFLVGWLLLLILIS